VPLNFRSCRGCALGPRSVWERSPPAGCRGGNNAKNVKSDTEKRRFFREKLYISVAEVELHGILSSTCKKCHRHWGLWEGARARAVPSLNLRMA